MDKIYKEIFKEVSKMRIIDTHEHLPEREELRNQDADIFSEYLIHYFSRDIISSGMKPGQMMQMSNTKIPIIERWKLIEPYWENSRHTGYGRALDLSAKGLYGIEKICAKTIEELNEKFKQNIKPGWFKKVLNYKCNIEISLLNTNVQNYDKELYKIVPGLDNFIMPQTGNDIMQVQNETGITIRCFDDWLEACKKTFDKFISQGHTILKCGLAYRRTLKFDKSLRCDAERGFNRIFDVYAFDKAVNIFDLSKEFQDYMMHYILTLADKNNVVYQYHTGLLEGNGNMLTNSDPSLMNNLFMQYPNVDFDIFHISYPYQNVLSALAKTFPNVYIDMCWAHVISPVASIRSLYEWIESVPINKISGFGGDYAFIDGVYGHQYIARENISKALSMKVKEGLFDIERAIEIAQMLLYDNPKKIFKLD